MSEWLPERSESSGPRYLQIVAATIYGWLLFSDVPKAATMFGAALIAASGLYTAWREHRRRLREAAAVVPAV